jgi:hypothetical protein
MRIDLGHSLLTTRQGQRDGQRPAERAVGSVERMLGVRDTTPSWCVMHECASVSWNPNISGNFALQCGCTIVWPDQNATQWKISYILTCSWAHDLIILFATDGLTQTIRYLRTEAAEVWQREWSEAHNGFDFCMLLGHLAMICPFQAQPWYDFKEAEIEKGKSWPPVSSAAAWTLFFSSHMLYLTSQRTKLRNF